MPVSPSVVYTPMGDRWEVLRLEDARKKLAAAVEAAAKKLAANPDDKQALEELNSAVEQLKKAKQPKDDPPRQ